MKNKLKLKAAARQTGSFRAEGNEIMLYGVIGSYWEELDAQKIVKHIKGLKGDVTVKINSPGGDVFDGIAIMNALKAHDGKVIIVVDGIAASIASVIAMAGSTIRMAEGAFLMIHNPWTIAMGDATEFRHTAGVLDQITETLVGIYSRKTGKAADEVKAMMNAETWISGVEAVELGFADLTDEQAAEVSNFDLSVFNNVPEPLRIAAQAAKPGTIRDLEKILHSAGFSRSEAKAVASGGFGALTQREADAEINSEKLAAAIENRRSAFN